MFTVTRPNRITPATISNILLHISYRRTNNRSLYIFQGRFSCCPVSTDEYLISVIQYILRNPIKAKIEKKAWDYRWSSASYHCGLTTEDPLVKADDLLSAINNWQDLLSDDSGVSELLEERNRTGRPFGSEKFYKIVENITEIATRQKTPGRPAKNSNVSPD